MHLDLHSVPFSRFGSYMALGIMPEEWHLQGLIFRTMHPSPTGSGLRELMRVELVAEGAIVTPRIIATPTVLRLAHGRDAVEFCFATPDVVRVRGRGIGLRLSSLNSDFWRSMPLDSQCWQFNPPAYKMQYLVTRLAGELAVDSRQDRPHVDGEAGEQTTSRSPRILSLQPGPDGVFECAIEELLSTPTGAGTAIAFDDCVRDVEAEWSAWRAKAPKTPSRDKAATELAMYVNWASTVAPFGMNRRATVLMSKNWMNQCWSWDHCFNAMALAHQCPDLAWDQMMVPCGIVTGAISLRCIAPRIQKTGVRIQNWLSRTKKAAQAFTCAA